MSTPRIVAAATLGLALASSAAFAQSAATGGEGTASGAAPVQAAPRSPSAASAGLGAQQPGRATATVNSIDRKLLKQEGDRPAIPGQQPSRSQMGRSPSGGSTPGG